MSEIIAISLFAFMLAAFAYSIMSLRKELRNIKAEADKELDVCTTCSHFNTSLTHTPCSICKEAGNSLRSFYTQAEPNPLNFN